mgnify:CR=1 FL=1
MKQMARTLIVLVAMVGTASYSFAENWQERMAHTMAFFAPYWDESSGSFPSEINFDGTQKSETRHLIATSRMIYGLAHTDNIEKARLQAKFMTEQMMRSDNFGPYFLSSVVPGEETETPSELVVNKQAYGLNGLVALYQKTGDQMVLNLIYQVFETFMERFHDEEMGGFFDKFNMETGAPIKTKSYNSTVYVATSFLFDLYEATEDEQFGRLLVELATLVARHFPDSETGFIIENFDSEWNPQWREWQKQPEGTIGISGHNFQAAWLLLRAAELTEVVSEKQEKLFKTTAAEILNSMLSKETVVDRVNGGVGDVYVRETGQTMWHTNKAWWQQAEAILALRAAEVAQIDVTNAKTVRKQIQSFYINNFIDRTNGGEFAVVTKEGTAVDGEMKAQAGKSTYHAIELARFMIRYGE